MKATVMAPRYLAILSCAFATCCAAGPPIAGYVPQADVAEHAKIDLDQQEIQGLLLNGTLSSISSAKTIYHAGKHSVSPDHLRTLADFSTGAPGKLDGETLYELYKAYWGSGTYADDFVSTFFDAASERPDRIAPLSELIVQGIAYQNTWMYVIHEMEDAILDCIAGDISNNGGAVLAWDEAWAFYAGSAELGDGSTSGFQPYALAEKRCKNFATCNGDTDGDPTTGKSTVNQQLLALYTAGQQAILNGNCGGAASILRDIVPLMTVPLVQGVLRYAYLGDPNSAGYEPAEEDRAGGWALVAAILPQLDFCDGNVAAVVRSNMEYLASTAGVVQDGYGTIFELMQQVYPCLGVKCSDIGGYVSVDGSFVPGVLRVTMRSPLMMWGRPRSSHILWVASAFLLDTCQYPRSRSRVRSTWTRKSLASCLPTGITYRPRISTGAASTRPRWTGCDHSRVSRRMRPAPSMENRCTICIRRTGAVEPTRTTLYRKGSREWAGWRMRPMWPVWRLRGRDPCTRACGCMWCTRWRLESPVAMRHPLRELTALCKRGTRHGRITQDPLRAQTGLALVRLSMPSLRTCVRISPLATATWMEIPLSGTAVVNQQLLSLFMSGQQALVHSNCGGAAAILQEIVPLMTVPLVQGLLRYAYLADEEAGNEEPLAKSQAEGWAFAAAVLPQFAYCNPGQAAFVRENMEFGVSQYMHSGYARVYRTVQELMPCLAMSCGDVGGYAKGISLDGSVRYVAGAEPCLDLDPNALLGSSPEENCDSGGGGGLSGGDVAGIVVSLTIACLAFGFMLGYHAKRHAGAAYAPVNSA